MALMGAFHLGRRRLLDAQCLGEFLLRHVSGSTYIRERTKVCLFLSGQLSVGFCHHGFVVGVRLHGLFDLVPIARGHGLLSFLSKSSRCLAKRRSAIGIIWRYHLAGFPVSILFPPTSSTAVRSGSKAYSIRNSATSVWALSSLRLESLVYVSVSACGRPRCGPFSLRRSITALTFLLSCRNSESNHSLHSSVILTFHTS